MAVAALVISIVALLLAGWSGWSTHRSARSAAEAVDLERVRHHDDRTPRLRLLYEPARPGQHKGGDEEGLWVLNAGATSPPPAGASQPGVGSFRPKRARVVTDQP